MDFAEKLRLEIMLNGPMTFDRFMATVVRYYYSTHDPFGVSGDFITAPEVSQMFGETLGVWLADKWTKHGCQKFVIIELGPGRGLMMQDILRATKNVPGMHDSLEKIYFVEQSKLLMEKQKEALDLYKDKLICYNDINRVIMDLQESQKNSVFLFANEFFDALPVKQYTKDQYGAREVCVDIKDGGFVLSYSQPMDLPLPHLSIGEIHEVSPQSKIYYHQIAELAKKSSNFAALVVDYGYVTKLKESTVQAVKEHKISKVLEDVGNSDITALVNFAEMSEYFLDLGLQNKIMTQAEFLLEYGIVVRAEMLINNGADSSKINSQLERLVDEKYMGKLFKVLELA